MSDKYLKRVQSTTMIAGDGDGIKRTTPARPPIPSARKFTPILKKDRCVKMRLEKALNEMGEPVGMKKTFLKSKKETGSVDTPKLIFRRKSPLKDLHAEETSIYATPRDYSQDIELKKRAGLIIYKYLLLKSWRKCKTNSKILSEALRSSNESVSQLNIQIDVLQKLRRSESSRREEITKDFQGLQRKHASLLNDNIILQDEYEKTLNENDSLKSQVRDVNKQLENQMQIHQQMGETLNIVNDKYQKERDKSKKYLAEKKTSAERASKYEELFTALKEKFENSKMCLENLQNSEKSLKTSLETCERKLYENFNELQKQLQLNENYKLKIIQCEDNEARLENELEHLKLDLIKAREDHSRLRDNSESILRELEDLSINLELQRKKSTWNNMKEGMIITFHAVKYLANLILPAIQSNLRNF